MTVETSIIIRTLNEAGHLERLIQSIHRQSYKDWEIVLVDSGSTDATLELARKYVANIQHVARRDFTYGRALNLGCQHSQGRYLACVSAHVYPVNDEWLGNLVRPFEDPKTGMVYGHQTGRSHLSEERHVDRYFAGGSKVLVSEPAGNNANAAVRKDLWVDQPYDESLPGLEDLDWARRVQARGYHVYYAADASVYHSHDESFVRIYRRYRREATAYARIFRTPPHSIFGLVPSYMVSVLRDFHYGLRRRAGLSRLVRVPATRLAFYLGVYSGERTTRKRGTPRGP